MKIHKYIIGLVAALSLSSCHILSYSGPNTSVFSSYDAMKEDLLTHVKEDETLYISNISFENDYIVSSSEYSYGGTISIYRDGINGPIESIELDLSSASLSFSYNFLDEQMYRAVIGVESLMTEYDLDNLYIDESTIKTERDYIKYTDELDTVVTYDLCTYSDNNPEEDILYGQINLFFTFIDVESSIIIAKEFGEKLIDNITITTITK